MKYILLLLFITASLPVLSKNIIYIVKKGDTLSEIINRTIDTPETRIYGKHGLLAQVIKQNHLKHHGDRLKTGEQIILHVPSSATKNFTKPQKIRLSLKEKSKNKKDETIYFQSSYGASFFSLDSKKIIGITNIAGGSLHDLSITTGLNSEYIGYELNYTHQVLSFSQEQTSYNLVLNNIYSQLNYKNFLFALSNSSTPLLKLNGDLTITSLIAKIWFISCGYKKTIKYSSKYSLKLKALISYPLSISSTSPLVTFSTLSGYNGVLHLTIEHKITNKIAWQIINKFIYTKWNSNINWERREGEAESQFSNFHLGFAIKYTL
jgi:hypothetical protein